MQESHARLYAPNRIKELRKKRGMSQAELGEALDPPITDSTVGKLENRRQALSLDYMLQIATALDVTLADIMGYTARSNAIELPVVGRIAAGNWQEAVAMSGDTQAVPGHLNGKDLFVLRPEGDSMDQVVPEGGYIVVDPHDREPRDRKLYVIMNGNGETTFKRFCANPLQLLPCSSNPNHKPIPVGAEPFVVIGRVVHVGYDT